MVRSSILNFFKKLEVFFMCTLFLGRIRYNVSNVIIEMNTEKCFWYENEFDFDDYIFFLWCLVIDHR